MNTVYSNGIAKAICTVTERDMGIQSEVHSCFCWHIPIYTFSETSHNLYVTMNWLFWVHLLCSFVGIIICPVCLCLYVWSFLMYQSVTVLQYVHVLLIFCCCTYSHCHCLSDWVCLQSTQLVITQPFHLPLSWISRHMYIRLYQSLSHYFVCLYVENCWRVLYASGCVSAAFVCLWVSKLCEVTEAFITDCAVS